MCLLDNREVRNGWQALKDAVAGIFTKHGAEVLSSRRWDERRLGYPMKGQLRGTYLLLYFKAPTGALTGIRRDLQFAEYVLRFLTMQCDEVPETAYEPEADFDVSAIPEEADDEVGSADSSDGAADDDSDEDSDSDAAGSEAEAEDDDGDDDSETESSEPEAKTEA
ncbi:MAG: 30S ribosomal protein S6 [Planctomycetes bacterium]|nr:30S ribosomal protein S6 [Planctomycetota bacterium]